MLDGSLTSNRVNFSRNLAKASHASGEARRDSHAYGGALCAINSTIILKHTRIFANRAEMHSSTGGVLKSAQTARFKPCQPVRKTADGQDLVVVTADAQGCDSEVMCPVGTASIEVSVTALPSWTKAVVYTHGEDDEVLYHTRFWSTNDSTTDSMISGGNWRVTVQGSSAHLHLRLVREGMQVETCVDDDARALAARLNLVIYKMSSQLHTLYSGVLTSGLFFSFTRSTIIVLLSL